MTKQKQLDTSHFVVKSNSLIEARYRLSLQESHIILWLLMQIKPEDEDFKEHELKISEFSRMVGLEAQGQYGEMQKITENLMRRILKIYQPETSDLLQVAWLSSALYKKKKGTVVLCFDPKLKPYLLQLKSCFTKIDIADTLQLKSIYAVRVFELLLQYLSIGQRKISIPDLRAYCGIEKDEYKKYDHLKSRVLNRAKTEINEKTDYEVDYTEIKESRKVVAINWTIKNNKKFISKTNGEKSYTASSAYTEAKPLPPLTKEAAITRGRNDKEKSVIEQLYNKLGENWYKSYCHDHGFIPIGIKEGEPDFLYEGGKYLEGQIKINPLVQSIFGEIYV